MAVFLALILAFQASPEVDNVVRGRLVFADGRAANNVAVEASIVLRASWTESALWIEPIRMTRTVRTHDDGHFEVFVEPDQRCERLFVHEPGFGRLQWQLHGSESRVLDLGEHVLDPGASLRGVVDGFDSVPFDLRMSLSIRQQPPDPLRSGMQVDFAVDPWTGEFEIDDLPRGIALLSAPGLSWRVQHEPIFLLPGRRTELHDSVTWYAEEARAMQFTLTRSSGFAQLGWAYGQIEHRVLRRAPDFEWRSPPCDDNSRHGGLTGGLQTPDFGPGDWTLELLDPRFEPGTTHFRVPTTEVQEICLTGSSSLQVLVRDARSGIEVRDARIQIVSSGWGFSIPELLRGSADPWPQDGVFNGVVAGDWTLKATCDGYAPASASVDNLAPRERRWVSVDLMRPGSIRGVVEAPPEVPLTELRAYLLQPRFPRHVAWEATLETLLQISDGGFGERRRKFAPIEADGTFRFDDVTPGLCRVQIIGAPNYLSSVLDVALRDGEVRDDVVATMPIGAYLSGRIDGPIGELESSNAFVVALLARNGSSPRYLDHGHTGTHRATIGRYGTFEVGPVAAGEYDVTLEFSSQDWLSNPTSRAVLIERMGTVRLAPGRARADFTAPLGRLDLRITSDEPLPHGCRFAARVGGSDERASRHAFNIIDVAGRDSNVRMRLTSGGWDLDLVGPGSSWSFKLPDSIEIRDRETVSLDVHVPLRRGRLRLIDASSGEPLCLFEVSAGAARGGYSIGESRFVTDARGEIELVLPRGEGHVRFAKDARARTFSWPPVAGEVQTLELAR